RKVGALAQPGDAQFNRSGARLPRAIPVAVALDKPLRALLAIAGAGHRPDLQLHQSFRGKADHLAQEIGVAGLLDQRATGDALVGHRSVPRIRLAFATRPYRRIVDDHREPARSLRRYLGARSRAASLCRATPPLGT